MNLDIIFDKFKDIRDKHEALFTIVVYNLTVEEIIQNIMHKMELAKNIKNPKKRSIVCKRFYNFKEYMKELKNDKIINSIYLVDDQIEEIVLLKDWLDVLNHFNVDTFTFRYNEFFELNYLKQLLTDTSFKHVINVKNNLLIHIHLNPTKRRIHHQEEIKSMDIEGYLKQNNVNEKCVIHGVSSAIRNVNQNNHFVFSKQLKDDEIFEVFRKDNVLKIQKEAEGYMDLIKNEKTLSRIVFGKDLQKKIMSMEIQSIYCSPDMHTKISEKVPKDYLNFNLIKVESLEKGDIGDTLKNNYAGAIGVTYF
ncbi:calycin family protein [Fadolivirus algeromassiliense]|jgi:hypothetical protein|uniref:Calycin family protein n=1 Tax=Fadolivirus FV1/VV64 TaxID=3070911 RepID=A0A7D3UW89_9VIRU|nr:calycin family protein [Fadolivirus algeromassiliense]QKF94654.1 calycin family protein [Fadolivirus FV1/VV64]